MQIYANESFDLLKTNKNDKNKIKIWTQAEPKYMYINFGETV